MTATPPNTITGAGGNVNLTSTATHQFAVWYDLTSELRIGRIQRGVQRWGVDHQEYTFAGAPRTALGLPVDTDEHKFPAIAVDGLGKIHVWANMLGVAGEGVRAVVTTAAHTADGWLATAGWTSAAAGFPSSDVSCTYPNPVTLADGGLWFYLRTGPINSSAGHSDQHFWTRTPAGTSWSARTLFLQGLSVPDAGGPGVPGSPAGTDDLTNWNAYISMPFVESPRSPHPGRLHLLWLWRETTLVEVDVLMSYGYSDDGGVTWRAADGTLLTLPVHPLNSVAVRVPGSALIRSVARASNIVVATVDTPSHGIVAGDSIRVKAQDSSYDGTFSVFAVGSPGPNDVIWVQAAANDPAGGVGSITKTQYATTSWALAVDGDGYPHIVHKNESFIQFHTYWTGTAWVRESIPNPLSGVLLLHLAGAVWLSGRGLRILGLGDPTNSIRARLWEFPTGGSTVVMGGHMGTSVDFGPSIDPEALRRFGTIEILVPDGNTPRVVTHGNHARFGAAA